MIPVRSERICSIQSAYKCARRELKLYIFTEVQWGKKVFSQPPIVQVLLLKNREACNFHHRYTSTMRDKIRKEKSRKSHCRIF